MPPEFLNAILNWGPLAVILFGILHRADQMIGALLPVVIEHFQKLGEALDTMKLAVENQTKQTAIMSSMASRLEEVGDGLSQDNAGIADDAKGAHHHARRAADGVELLLRHVPQRTAEKEAG